MTDVQNVYSNFDISDELITKLSSGTVFGEEMFSKMEVMAEAHEQPALLNQDVDSVKRPRRTKTTAGVRKTTANKTSSRRTKKQAKGEKPSLSDANNHSTSVEGQDGLPPADDLDAPRLRSPSSQRAAEETERLTEERRGEMDDAVENLPGQDRFPFDF